MAETFHVAWRRRDDVPTDDALPWLLAVARNVWLNQRRRHDELFDVLRRARPGDLPDELVSSTTPAAQALLEEILSMDTTHAPDAPDGVTGDPPTGTGHDGTPVLDTLTATSDPRRGRPSRRRLLVVGAAAAAVVAVATTAILTVDSSREQVDAATVEAALVATAQAMEDTGRAEVTWRLHDDDEPERASGVDEIAYSGQDIEVRSRYGDAPPQELRIVDGEWYTTGEIESDADWYHHTDETPERTFPDPRTLLDELAVAGTFDDVGEEDVDGVPTRRLRAANPEATPDEIVASSCRGRSWRVSRRGSPWQPWSSASTRTTSSGASTSRWTTRGSRPTGT